jgi:hypothetical protein
MRGLFAVSYGILYGLVVLEGLVLREAIRRTVSFKRFYADLGRGGKPELLAVGTSAPEFSAPVAGTAQSLTREDLRGHPSILLFVSPEEASFPNYQKLADGVNALWHKVAGHVYLFCTGGEEACRQFARDHHVGQFGENHRIPIVLDEGARIARGLHIGATPQAVELDEDARVKRYGSPGEGQ